ncbi:MAG: hypothetical protein HQK72_18005 [Desulfamplus sp.]|nr:hypothetical protein [Desulfamplus sp.]
MTVKFPSMNNTSTNQVFSDNFLKNNKTYSSFDQMNQVLLQYGEEQTKIYENQFSSMENGAKISVDELKETIRKEFPTYKMISSEPADVVDGQNLLYIDEKNLQKMANDADYRAKVFGLMRREGDSLGRNNVRVNGELHSFMTTGSIFSLSDRNENVGGIPYKGSAKSMSMSVSSSSNSNSRTIGKNEDWFEKMLERIKKKREEEKRLEESHKEKEPKQAESKDINIYI